MGVCNSGLSLLYHCSRLSQSGARRFFTELSWANPQSTMWSPKLKRPWMACALQVTKMTFLAVC